MAYWDDFVTAIVTRYHDRIKNWECWNEANNTSQFWLGTVVQLANQCHDLYTIAKGIDPGLTITTPSATGGSGAVSSWFNQYFGVGGGNYADVVAFHGYPSICCAANSNPAPEEAYDIVAALKASMTSYGQSDKPIWDTEGGWGMDVTTPDASAQAAFLARHYIVQWNSGVSRYAWYMWDNGGWGTLWSSSTGITPAEVAYQQVYNWIVGATMLPNTCAVSGSVWQCGLSRTGGYQGLVVWNTTGSTYYTAPSWAIKYATISGSVVSISGGSSTPIGASPILFSNQ